MANGSALFAVQRRGGRADRKAQARLAKMRTAGLNPGHGGEATKTRGAALARNNRLRITGTLPSPDNARLFLTQKQ